MYTYIYIHVHMYIYIKVNVCVCVCVCMCANWTSPTRVSCLSHDSWRAPICRHPNLATPLLNKSPIFVRAL